MGGVPVVPVVEPLLWNCQAQGGAEVTLSIPREPPLPQNASFIVAVEQT